MNVFRLPFEWERLQASQSSSLDANELAHIDDFRKLRNRQRRVGHSRPAQFCPLLWNRNWRSRVGLRVLFADLWSRLATRYKSNPRVWFGLMNEPNNMSTEQWVGDANAAITSIRAAGASNLILVPGNAWTGAWTLV